MFKIASIILLFIIVQTSTRARPAIIKQQVTSLPLYQPLLKEIQVNDHVVYTIPTKKQPPPDFQKCDIIELANVPRSGSTWFLTVLNDAFNSSVRVIGHHFPFHQQRLYHLEEEEEDTTICRLVLIRNPLDVWPSYNKQFPGREMVWEQFLQKWREFYGYYYPLSNDGFFISYEHLGVDPRGALGGSLEWFEHLRPSLLKYGYRQGGGGSGSSSGIVIEGELNLGFGYVRVGDY